MPEEKDVAEKIEEVSKAFSDESLGDLLTEKEQFGEEIPESAGETDLTKEEVQKLEEMKGEKLTPEELAEAKDAKNAKDETGGEVEIPEKFEDIDPTKLPPELKTHFNKMLNAYTQRIAKIADIEKKAQLFDYISQNPQFLQQRIATERQPSVDEESQIVKAEETLFKSLNIPEDHELSPAMRAMTSLLIRNMAATKKAEVTTTQTSFKTSLNTFIGSKPGLREDVEFLNKMDEIGMENPKLYENLGRLYGFTKAELGRDHRPSKSGDGRQGAKIDIAKLYRDMKTAKKQKTSRPSSSPASSTIKRAKTVAEAFAQAEEMLSRK